MSVEVWVQPEYEICKFIRTRLAEIFAESPDRTIKSIFEYSLPLTDSPSYTDVRDWFDKLEFNVDVGDPTIFGDFPRMVIHWAEDSEKGFAGAIVDEENSELGGLVYTYGSEFSGQVMCSIQGYGNLEPGWMHQIILRILIGGKAKLEDRGVRGISGIQTKDLEWLSAKGDGSTVRGRMMMIPCTYSKFFKDEQDTGTLEQIENVQAIYFPEDETLP